MRELNVKGHFMTTTDKWLDSLTANTAADRCRKWIGGKEIDDESDSDEESPPPRDWEKTR